MDEITPSIGSTIEAALALAERIRHAKKVLARGVMYSPRFWMRKPEWMPVGQAVGDARSAFYELNITAEQRAYARELAIERRAAR